LKQFPKCTFRKKSWDPTKQLLRPAGRTDIALDTEPQTINNYQ
jgi:hypothetical protein